MIEHKEGCKWNVVQVSVTKRQPDGEEEMLAIDRAGLTYSCSLGRQFIVFKFCPLCGVKLE